MWLATIDPRLSFNLSAHIVTARQRAGLKHDSLATLMGISSQQLSQQLAERGHISLQRLLFAACRDQDGKRFLRELFLLIKDEMGWTDFDAIAARLSELVNAVQVRMARSQLQAREDERRVG